MTPTSRELAFIALTAVATFTAAYFGMKGSQATARPDYVRVLQDENNSLRGQLSEMRARLTTLSIKIADLERLVGGTTKDVEAGAIFAYLDAMKRRPAWCKIVEIHPPDAPVFRMAYLNDAYEDVYGVTLARYIGGTDFDNHPPVVAQSYYENDLETYLDKDYKEFDEPLGVTDGYGARGNRQFSKFWVALPSGPQYICGMQVNGAEIAP